MQNLEDFNTIFCPKLDECFKYDTRLGIPQIMYKCSLDNFEGNKPDVRPGFITGKVGTGKTHLAIGYLRKEIGVLYDDKDFYLDKMDYYEGAPASYKNNEDFKKMVVENMSKRRFDFILNFISFISAWRYVQQMKEFPTANETRNKYEGKQFLVIDDLGIERPTDYALDVLTNLILCRYEERKATLITSNLSLEEIDKLFGERVASRIASFGEQLYLTGEDRRITK